MDKRILLVFIAILCIVTGIGAYRSVFAVLSTTEETSPLKDMDDRNVTNDLHPLSIEYMRKQEYRGSDIVIEQTLPNGSHYSRYIVSYISDGLKIYALLTIPQGEKPITGWPVIMFNHGYIPPEQYRTTERYIAYTDAFSRNGYIVFRSDYRGHGNSEGQTEYPEYSSAYTIDILNAISSVKKLKDPSMGLNSQSQDDSGFLADPNRIGMWGHSMGGTVTLRALVVSKDIKAADIWAGVVGTYQDLAENHHGKYVNRPSPLPEELTRPRRPNGRIALVEQYGDTTTNPKFWESIDPMNYLKDISAPIQIQHGTADEEVPYVLSQKFDAALKNAGKITEFYTYEGDDHNLSNNLTVALQRSVDFFDRYVKGRE